jgi:hypothetical protein
MNVEKAARDRIEAARAALEDALDEMDGVKGDGVNMDALRSRVGAEIARGKLRASADPLKAAAISAAVGVGTGLLLAATFFKRLVC